MIDALISRDDEYFFGTRYKKKTDKQGDSFQYEILDHKRKSYGTIVNNLIAEQGRLTIKTNWNIDFKKKQYIVDNDDVRWQIAEIQIMVEETNPCVNAILKKNPDTSIVLSLVEVDNVEELE